MRPEVLHAPQCSYGVGTFYPSIVEFRLCSDGVVTLICVGTKLEFDRCRILSPHTVRTWFRHEKTWVHGATTRRSAVATTVFTLWSSKEN